MVRFKVKPKRGKSCPSLRISDSCAWMERWEEKKTADEIETVPPPCLPALTTLLACFATTGDMRANEACANAAKSLHTCMAGSKGAVKASKSSVSHVHLFSRFGKRKGDGVGQRGSKRQVDLDGDTWRLK